jgi:hypothetical protein
MVQPFAALVAVEEARLVVARRDVRWVRLEVELLRRLVPELRAVIPPRLPLLVDARFFICIFKLRAGYRFLKQVFAYPRSPPR